MDVDLDSGAASDAQVSRRRQEAPNGFAQWHDLRGRVALVTGANSGIGLAMATGLARAGAAVALWGTNRQRNVDAVALIEGEVHGADVAAFCCDVSVESAVDNGVEAVISRFGRLDFCFANAGIGGDVARIGDLTTTAWRRTLGVNLDGAFYTLRAAARQLRSQGHGGALVTTASLSAVEGAAQMAHYAASKGGLLALTRALAADLARDDITVNAVMPGWTDTAMTSDGLHQPAAVEKILPRIPMRRWGRPDDFEAIAVFLAGSGARYITGQTIVVDGGYSIF